jgi:hypothetical protein
MRQSTHINLPCSHTEVGRRFVLNRIVTVFGQKEFASLQAFCKRNRLSLYSLAKTSIREYVLRHA